MTNSEITFEAMRKKRLTIRQKNRKANMIIIQKMNLIHKEIRPGWLLLKSPNHNHIEFNPSTNQFIWSSLTGNKNAWVINVKEKLKELGCV